VIIGISGQTMEEIKIVQGKKSAPLMNAELMITQIRFPFSAASA